MHGRIRAYTPLIISLLVYMYNVRAHMYIAGDPLPCGEISRTAFFGISMQKHAVRFKGGGISRCGEISKKYGSCDTRDSIQHVCIHVRINML